MKGRIAPRMDADEGAVSILVIRVDPWLSLRFWEGSGGRMLICEAEEGCHDVTAEAGYEGIHRPREKRQLVVIMGTGLVAHR